MFDWLTQEVGHSDISYLIVFVGCATDVLLPLVPSETIVITAAILAAQSELLIYLIVPAATLGALLGDNACYWLGRGVGDPVARRLFRGEKGRERLQWAEQALDRRGAVLIAAGRFIPGGRTATTFAAGTLEMRYRYFLFADAVAALLWALYVSALGYLGGEAFKDELWLPLGASLGFAALVALGFEGWRRLQRQRGRDMLGDEVEA
ncbi:MAG: DedA family protein [Solirubrobacterales bacterium]